MATLLINASGATWWPNLQLMQRVPITICAAVEITRDTESVVPLAMFIIMILKHISNSGSVCFDIEGLRLMNLGFSSELDFNYNESNVKKNTLAESCQIDSGT